MRFSASTGCFYPEELTYQQLPEDIVAVPYEDFEAAMKRPEGTGLALAKGRLVVVPVVMRLPEARLRHKAVIAEAFRAAPAEGLLTSLGLRVDCDRIDKDNMTVLLGYSRRKGLKQVTLRLHDNSFATISVAELEVILHEIEEHGLGLYQRKWAREMAIDTAETVADVAAVIW